MCLLICAGCSQHKLHVIGADKDQFDQLQRKLKHSGIQVINKNELSSEFEKLTLVSAISFPIAKVEAALDQIVYTSLAQEGNQFYTDSAGLYFPSHTPKIVDIFTNSCQGYTITLTTLEENHFNLTVEQFVEEDQTSMFIKVKEVQGTFTINDKIMNAYDNGQLIFKVSELKRSDIQSNALKFLTSNLSKIKPGCTIFKRKNWS